jgi:hypothetical protein
LRHRPTCPLLPEGYQRAPAVTLSPAHRRATRSLKIEPSTRPTGKSARHVIRPGPLSLHDRVCRGRVRRALGVKGLRQPALLTHDVRRHPSKSWEGYGGGEPSSTSGTDRRAKPPRSTAICSGRQIGRRLIAPATPHHLSSRATAHLQVMLSFSA